MADRAAAWSYLRGRTGGVRDSELDQVHRRRQSSHHSPGTGVDGITEDFLGPLTLDNLPLVHDRNTVANGCDREKIVRDKEYSHTQFPAESGEEVEDLRLGIDVEGAGGLIGNQKRGSVEDGHSDEDALGLTNAELGGVLPKNGCRKTDILESLPEGLLALRTRRTGLVCSPGLF